MGKIVISYDEEEKVTSQKYHKDKSTRKKVAPRKQIKLEFSKMLAILNTVAWVLTLIYCAVAWLFFQSYPETLLITVNAQYAAVISMYMYKSKSENCEKIAQNYIPDNNPYQAQGSTQTDDSTPII